MYQYDDLLFFNFDSIQVRSVLKGDLYSSFVTIVQKYMREKNCNEFIDNLDKLFPNKTPEIISVLLGKQ